MDLSRTSRYRAIWSVVFGLIGFGVNFLDIQLVECSSFRVSILFGLLFPLLITLAWGWRYGLLSAVCGGCQSMWWLWRSDGWGLLYAVPVFTLWIVWHGWWADRRRSNPAWYRSVFVVEIPFRLVMELGFYTMFRWLVSMNPPPWNTGISWDYVSVAWVNTVVLKHIFTGYILLLVAYSVLSLGAVRRFFRLVPRPEQRDVTAVYTVAILSWLLFWAVDAGLEWYLYNPESRTFWEMAVFQVEAHKLLTRLLVFIVAFCSAAVIASLIRRMAHLNRRLVHLNRLLIAIRNVNQLITHQKDIDILLNETCRLLVDTHGFHNAWIALLGEERNVESYYCAGFNNDTFAPMDKALKAGVIPDCAVRVLEHKGVHVVQEPFLECRECPLVAQYQEHSALVMRLEHEGHLYGWLSVSVPRLFAGDIEEQSLFAEVVEDVAYALWSHDSGTRLQTLEQQYVKVLASTSDAVIATDEQGQITLFNPGAESLFECSAEDVMGTPIDRFCPEDRRAEQKELMETVRQTGMIRAVETERVTAQGRRVVVEMTIDLSLDKYGKPIGMSGILRDITDRKKFEWELVQAKELAEAANQAKNVFLANMSHELRTPLNPIMGFTEMILEEADLTEEHRELLEMVNRRGKDLLQLLSDLLDITRVEGNQVVIRPQAVDIQALIKDVVAMFEHDANEKGIGLQSRLNENLPVMLLMDPARVRQILMNLIGNSIKFTEQGSIQVSACLDSDDGMLLMEVRDTGCGINTDQQELIFDSFQQGDGSSTREYGGAGLGLAICKRLVGLMSGTIHVESQAGQGSVFQVKLPIAPVREAGYAQSLHDVKNAVEANQPLHILLVEDDMASKILTDRVLTRAGHILTCVFDGQTAVDICAQQQFDLILMDIKLPVMDGIEATRKIRAQGCQTPIIAVTACAFEEDRLECLKAGMNAWVTKPITPAILKQAISKLQC